MKHCKEDIPVEFSTINILGKDYWVDEEGRLVISKTCNDVSYPTPVK